MRKKHIDLHNHCQCEIRYREFRGKDQLTPGLFCSDHDVFLDWLKQDIADELVASGINIAPYSVRKKPKKTKAKPTHYQQWHKNNKKQRVKTQRLTHS